jgi:hypothetical protein
MSPFIFGGFLLHGLTDIWFSIQVKEELENDPDFLDSFSVNNATAAA